MHLTGRYFKEKLLGWFNRRIMSKTDVQFYLNLFHTFLK